MYIQCCLESNLKYPEFVLKHSYTGGLNIRRVFPLRTEDPVAEGQNPSTWTTRTNLTSAIVREKKTSFFVHHVPSCDQCR